MRNVPLQFGERLQSFDEADGEQQNYRSNDGHDDGADQSTPDLKVQRTGNISADYRTDDSNDDVNY
jgi:hypothetical protein